MLKKQKENTQKICKCSKLLQRPFFMPSFFNHRTALSLLFTIMPRGTRHGPAPGVSAQKQNSSYHNTPFYSYLILRLSYRQTNKKNAFNSFFCLSVIIRHLFSFIVQCGASDQSYDEKIHEKAIISKQKLKVSCYLKCKIVISRGYLNSIR